MQLSAVLAIAPIFKTSVENLTKGLGQGYAEIARGYGDLLSGIGRRIGGPPRP